VGEIPFGNICSGYTLQVLAPASLWAFHFYPAALQQYIFFHLLLCNRTPFIAQLYKFFFMGLVYADITLINGDDLALARKSVIGEDEVKQMPVNILVDTGSIMLCINESIQEQLQFPFDEKRKTVTADGRIVECDVVTGVELRFKNRKTTCRAMVLPGNSEPLLGAIPLEDMDVLIHPQRQELIVNPEHPYFAQMKLKSINKI
jgi:clan AA aspartic protease